VRSISGQSNARRYRNVLRCRLNVTRVDDLLTKVGRLFQTVGADTRKARAAVSVLTYGTASNLAASFYKKIVVVE